MMEMRPGAIMLSPLIIVLGLVVMGLFIGAIAGKGRTRSIALGVLVFFALYGFFTALAGRPLVSGDLLES